MNITQKVQNLPIRQKLLYGYLLSFFLVVILGNALLYIYVRDTIERNIQSELKITTSTILSMVRSSVDASITNHLRAIAEKNLEIVTSIHQRQKAGEFSEAQAKKLAAEIIASQTIGKTGYIYCVNSLGIIQVHSNKNLIGKNLSQFDFIHNQKERRTGYLEYDWANPGETVERPKALYMSYFGPWDWIISASSYRDEFNTLVEVDDLKDHILSIRFGETGYPYVMDSKGNLIIHPQLEGENIYESEDSDGHKFIKEMCRRKNGSIIYPWRNPGEPVPREKLVFFNYIPELDWIVASSSYLEEFYEPLQTVTGLTLISVLLMVALTLPLTWFISSSITKPLHQLMTGLSSVAKGDFSKRLIHKSNDEIGQLAEYFNATMSELEESNTRLHESEKKFRSIFENSVEGIFQLSPEGMILNANPSFAAMAGYHSFAEIDRAELSFQESLLADPTQWPELLNILKQEKAVKSYELQLRKQSGTLIWCMLSAKPIYRGETGELLRIEGFLTDINDLKMAQNAQRAIQEELENRVAERTAELSGWIEHLEEQDGHNRLVHEMSDILQTCSTIHETFPVIHQYLQLFFPDYSCSLYMFDDSQIILDRCVPPVSEEQPPSSLMPEDCWALRQGKPYRFSEEGTSLACAHLQKETERYLCIPLIAHGVTTGLMHLAYEGEHSRAGLKTTEESSRRSLQLSARLAEHLSLALANLKLREELEQLSLRDSLTGLSNRRHMEEILKRQLFRQKRHGTPFSLLMLDIDHFKSFNDDYGHEVGDEILVALGSHLLSHSRGEDLPCRYGGEEFILILAETDAGQAKKRADLLLAEIAQEVEVSQNGDALKITVSIGVATCPENGETLEALLKAADQALYQAKRNGRNQVQTAAGK